jgi:AcrR family transcriptional regulator
VTEGLRERKKRLTRQRISDTATAMFLERGFDAVTVADIARACDVSEKTVFNYFPTKESLVLDREADWAEAIRTGLATGTSLTGAATAIIEQQLTEQYDHPALDPEAARGVARLIQSSPSLRAANQAMTARLTDQIAEAVAVRTGADPGDPEPQIAAAALTGLWRVQFRAMHRHAGLGDPSRIRDAVLADVRAAARLIDQGLRTYGR